MYIEEKMLSQGFTRKEFQPGTRRLGLSVLKSHVTHFTCSVVFKFKAWNQAQGFNLEVMAS
jgi:hypothetical protein